MWKCWNQKGKLTILDFNEAQDDKVAVVAAKPNANYLHLAADRNHVGTSSVSYFTGKMPNQHNQSIDGITLAANKRNLLFSQIRLIVVII